MSSSPLTEIPANSPGSSFSGAAEAVRRCAQEILPRIEQVSADVVAQLLVQLPGLAPPGADDALEAVRESTDQTLGALYSTMAYGVPATAAEPPLGTKKLLVRVHATGGDIADLLRAYNCGLGLLWQHWSEHVAARITDPQLLREVLEISSQHMFTFVDRSASHLVDLYRAEFGQPHQRALGEASAADVIRSLLGDAPVDESAAGSHLAFDVHGHHVAMVLAPVGDATGVRRALDDLIAVSGARALTLPVGDGTWWVWFGWTARPDGAVLERLAATPLDGVLAGMGSVGKGREGFRGSHLQARETVRVGRLSRHPRVGVIRHCDVELAAVLCADPDRARSFAAARLGPLGDDNETCERLRETVLAFVSEGCSKTRVAQVLHVHQKTVSYRLAQAEKLLGRPLTQNVLELGAALLVDRTLRGATAAL